MPRVNPLFGDFSSGEIGPRMLGRVDFEKYPNAAEIGENLLTAPQGAFYRRPGTRYVAETKTSTNKSYLFPFEVGVDSQYVIEGGANYFRFFRDQGQLSVADTDAAIVNGAFPSGITSWTDRSGASSSIAHDATNLRLSLISNGTTDGHAEQSVTIDSAYTAVAHVLRFRVYGVHGDFVKLRIGTSSKGTEVVNDVELGVGFHAYTFTPGATTFYVQFLHTRAKTIGIDDVDILDNVPLELVTPYTAAQIQTFARPQANDVMYIFPGATTAPYKLIRRADTSWSLEEVGFIDGPYLDQHITSILPANGTTGIGTFAEFFRILALSTTLSPAATTGLGITLTASSTRGINGGQGFLSTDVGRLVRIQQSSAADAGYAVITAVGSTTSATIDIRRDFNVTTATTSWWLGALSETTGYPSAATFHEQRLVAASSTDHKQSLWFSQSADIENMRPDTFDSSLTVEDDDAINITLAARQSNQIRWLESARDLIAGTAGGEWVLKSDGAIITPTDIDAKRNTTLGSSGTKPVQVNGTVIFPQRAERKLFDYRYNFDLDRYDGRELTILGHRVLGDGVNELDYQQEPDSIVYGVRTDGQLACLTYKPEDGTVSWTRLILGGSFSTGNAVVDSVATIQGASGSGRTIDSDERNEVWCIVKRTVNGLTKRFIEFFEKSFEGPLRHDYTTEALWDAAMITAQKDAMYSDSALTYNSAATTSISGLSHLEGETVKILADGAVHPDKTVSSGAITLDYSASKVQVGLGYHHRYKSLKLNFGAALGTAVGKVKRIHGVTFVLLDSVAFQFGKDFDSLVDVEFREIGDAMDTAVPLKVGEKDMDFNGEYGTDARIYIQSDNPLPWVMLAMAPKMKTNEGL